MNEIQRTRTLFLLVIGYFTVLITVYFQTEYDPYWHIRVGEWIINNHKVPGTGIFSHTKADASWTPHSWLSEVILYLIFNAAGWPGLVVMGVTATTLSILIMLKYLLEKLPPVRALCFMLMGYGMLITHIMPRPHILALPVMTFWFVQLLKASEQHKAPSLYNALLLILWANIHGSYLIGIVYAVFFAFESVVSAPPAIDRIRLTKQWVIFLAVSIACLMATPLGVDGLLLPFQLTDQSYMMKFIGEWQSSNFQTFQFLELWIVIIIIFGFTQKMELPLLRLIFLIALIHLSLKHCRYATDLMSLQAPLILAAPLAKHWRVSSGDNKFTLGSLLPVTTLGRILIISALISWSIYILAFKDTEYLLSKKVNSMLLAIRQAELPGKVFNDYNIGGFLIFQGFDTFIDSRAELYKDEFIKSTFEATSLAGSQKPLEALLNQYDISWSFLSSESPAIAYFNMHPDWTPVYANKFAVIHVRKGRWSKQAIDQLKLKLQKQDDASG
jgi:hypothetical protein